MGNSKPHKNLELLARIADSLPAPLVLLAGRGAGKALGFPESTIDLGELSDAELPLLYASAEALLYPSLYEGFGLPPLEAMASGCPVVAARGSSLTEVCGEAALLVDPHSGSEWKEAILKVCRDAALRRELSERGRERASRFSWDDCARKTLAVYERVLDQGLR
jgi:glycosyltransferase involved in cell wall biosynthesis